MKTLDRALEIGPKRAEQFVGNGILTLKDFAQHQNLPDLSRRMEIPLDQLQQWHAIAIQKVKASRYRRRVGLSIALLVLVALLVEIRPLFRSPGAETEGDAFYEQGNYKMALERYNKAIKLNPDSATAYGSKGSALRMLGHYHEAEESLNKAIQLDPQSVWAYNERGALYTNEKQYEKAVAEYDKALAINPNYKYAYAKAFPLQMLGRHQEALAAATRALEIDPSWAWAYVERAAIYHDVLFRFEPAYHDLQKASQIGNEVDTQADLAEAALSAGQFDEAYKIARRLLTEYEKTDNNDFEVSERCAMRFIAISALLLQDQKSRAREQLEDFIAYYKANETRLTRDWEYTGTQHYIANRKMDASSRRIMLALIQLLQRDPTIGIDAIEKLVPTLPNAPPSPNPSSSPKA